MMENATFLHSDLLNPIEALTKERDRLLTTAEDLREKLKEAVSRQQEIDGQRDAALENIAQVNSCDSYAHSWARCMLNIWVTYCIFQDCALILS